jgi:hypothetical protein
VTTLKDLIARDNVREDVRYGTDGPIPENFAGFSPWTVTLRRKRRQLTVPFYTGPAITEDPTAHGVLDCLLSDASAGEQTFEDFADEFGYDQDSRKAYATWESCVKMAERVRTFLGDAFEEYLYSERD